MLKAEKGTVFTTVLRLPVVILLWLTVASGSYAQENSLHALRSAYLYYFSHFIRWPEITHFANSRLNLCALTDDDNDKYQLRTIDNKSLGENNLKIILLSELPDSDIMTVLGRCNMIYISAGYSNWLDIHETFISRNTLLVTEGATSNKGAIHLFITSSKLNFEIDNQLLSERNFKVSSKLLRLSKKRGGQ